MANPTVGSLFAGIGGFDLGFERAGFRTAWQVEIDPWCRKVLAKHFPQAERFEDVRTVGQHNLAPVDVIVGGFPCQDISNAGLRAGIGGERSGLWGEFARIIGELRPRFVLVENVAALLGRGMGRVLGDLSALGYDAEWEVVSAADVGAPHLRERVWILAYPRSFAGRQRPGVDLLGRWPREAEQVGMGCGSEDVADPYGYDEHWWGGNVQVGRRGRESETANDGNAPGTQWRVEPAVGRVAHGVPARVDRLRGLGNAVVPQIPEMYARRIREVL